MPVVFRDRGLRYFFFSNEGLPREPRRIHVKAAEMPRCGLSHSKRRMGKGAQRRAHAFYLIRRGCCGGHASLCPPYSA